MKTYSIKKLSVYDPAYTGVREEVSIHTNEKGSLIKLSVDQNINLIGVIDFKVGKPARGNHYHTVKNEYFYLLEGKVNGYFKELYSDKVEHHIIDKGTLVHLMPGCAHAFTAIEDGYAIEYCSNLSSEIENDSNYVLIIE